MKVEPDYFSSLDANFARLDYSERPELQKGTVDFDVSQLTSYWASNPTQHLGLFTTLPNPTLDDRARRPENMRYIFVLDVSDTSMRSGFLAAACVALRAIVYGRFAEDGSEAAQVCLPSGCSIALVTFDDVLHLYDLSVCTPLWVFFMVPGINSLLQPNQTSPRQLVVPDVDEPFLPIPPSTLFVDPHQSRCANFSHYLGCSSVLCRPRAVIESLFDNLQQRQTLLPPGATSHSCLGSALRTSLEALVCSTSSCHYD